jgi:hypothetical protein
MIPNPLTVLLLLLLPGFFHVARSQQPDDYYRSGYIRYEDFIYRPNIRTVVFEMANLRLSDPILELGSSEKLVLTFDDLDGDFKYYSYTIIHCNADWSPSNLLSHEYIGGFTDDRIIDYRSSFNTIQKYTHYRQEIPGREVQPLISGNYILKVYEEGQPDTPVLTRRFLVVDVRVSIEASIQQATIVSDRNSKHEIDFTVAHNNIRVSNPFDEIKVVLRQNGRWDNIITGLKPLFLKDQLLDYSYDGENTFTAGNEFRTFDIRTLRLYTEFVREIVRGPDGYTVVLLPGVSRSFSRYVTENDINGRYLIRNQDGTDGNLDGEYVNVKFSLKHEILANGNFYVFGALTDWRADQRSQMTYNYDEGTYEALLYLKQGYYDYHYAFVEDGKNMVDVTVVEGSHYETANDYTILVYFRPVGSRHDQLVGIKRTTSR